MNPEDQKLVTKGQVKKFIEEHERDGAEYFLTEECLEAIDQLPAVPARRARAEIEKAIGKHEKHLELIRTVPDLKLARQFDSAVIKALKWVLRENNRLIAEKEVEQDGKKDS